MARKYTRDNRGRFASSGATARGGRLRTASGAKRATVTRKINARPANTISKSPAPKLTPLVRRPIANNIRRTRQTPLKLRGNTIKPYRPTTFDGKFRQIDRQIDKTMKPLADGIRDISSRAKAIKPQADAMALWIERMNARSISNRRRKDVEGEIARAELGAMGTAYGQKAIGRRMQRALSAAARGSSAGKRATQVYLNQLAGMGPGKPSKGRNNLRPGPRNSRGTPKRKRRKG